MFETPSDDDIETPSDDSPSDWDDCNS